MHRYGAMNRPPRDRDRVVPMRFAKGYSGR
jgi:hypothetical protein